MNIFSKRKVLVKTALIFLIIVSSCGEKDNPAPQNTEPIVTDKGTPTGQLVSASIGTSGGTLQSADGKIKLDIPAGALSSTTTVSIQPVSNEAPLGLGQGYRLLPEGVTFTKPVKITFQYDDQLLGNAIEDFLWIVTQAEDGTWNAMLKSVVDTNSKTVSVEATHFSDWMLGKFIELTLAPSAATLLVGKSMDLKVSGFYRDKSRVEVSDSPDELAPLVPISSNGLDELTALTPIPPLESRLQDFRVKGWTLNGASAPVTNNNGSLSVSGMNATFKAPSKRPASNPVAVTVQLEGSNLEGRKTSYLLTSNISILESELYTILTVDGETFEYYQYGFNGTIPANDNDYFIANCGRSVYSLDMVSTHIVGNSIFDSFTLSIENPAKGTKTLGCLYTDSHDAFTYSASSEAMSSAYMSSYSKRQKKGDQCESVSLCGSFSVTILEYDGKAGGIVQGTFSGTVYEDKEGYEKQCKTPDEHTVSGEFRLVVVN